jgi:hypothetical protein
VRGRWLRFFLRAALLLAVGIVVMAVIAKVLLRLVRERLLDPMAQSARTIRDGLWTTGASCPVDGTFLD